MVRMDSPGCIALYCRRLSWSPDAKALSLHSTAQDLFKRHTSDDFLVMFLILINQYVTPVPQVSERSAGLRCTEAHRIARHGLH